MADQPCRLRGSANAVSWSLDFDEFEAAFSVKTRAVILNTPHNPTGKVLKRELRELG